MQPSRVASQRWKNWGAGVAIVAALGGVVSFLVVWFLCGHVINDVMHRQRFDFDDWKHQKQSERSGDWPIRLCMADDLLASGRLSGLTKSQVVELLGPPDSKDFGYSYYLGPERGFVRIDSETLVIEFGEDKKVSRSQIHRD